MCTDAARWRGEATFNLRAILLWCIHDFPAYAMMAGTSNKGFCACPVCGPGTPSRYSDNLSKVVYGGSHRRWLPSDHPFRRDVTVFAKEELGEEPTRMDATSHIRWAYLRAEYARYGGRLAVEGDPMLCSGVKRIPALFTLPYWRVREHSNATMHSGTLYIFPNNCLVQMYAGATRATSYRCHACGKKHSGVRVEIFVWGQGYTRIEEGHGGAGYTT